MIVFLSLTKIFFQCTQLYYVTNLLVQKSTIIGDKGLRYENIDWEKLLPEVKAAATTLKYTKEIWDNDKKSSVDEKDWCELSADEKAAASVLGYDEDKWDG